ncbi:hypothetical protein E2320_010750 [Naja naja]|nr:hypothetical protein E2320_010750 [Naja naja]
MAPKEATPAQGTQGSLTYLKTISGTWRRYSSSTLCALPQPERAKIIKHLDAVKSKLWSLSLPDKDPLGFQGVYTDLPAEAPLGLSPECLIRKFEDPGLLQTPSADATEYLPAKQPINATSTN